jgi:hypothetical protein
LGVYSVMATGDATVRAATDSRAGNDSPGTHRGKRALLGVLEDWFPTDRPLVGAVRVFVAALGIRWIYLLAHTILKPFWPIKEFDFNEMGSIAVNLFQGRGFSSPFFHGNVPTAWECPLVPFVWAAVMRLLGEASQRTYRMLVIIQTVPAALSVSLYWLIARYLVRRTSGLRPYTPFIVAALFCFWPEAILRIQEIWYFVWQEAALAALMCVALWWCDMPSRRSGSALGAAAGVLALINVTPLPIYPVALVEPLARIRRNRAEMLGAALLSVVIAGAIVAPWLIRNAVELGAFVPMRSNSWKEVFQGNNPKGNICENAASLHPAYNPSEAHLYRTLGEIDYMRFCRERAIRYIRSHPGLTAWRAAQRFYVVWFTDLFDQWPWNRAELQRRDMLTRVRLMIFSCSAVVPLVIVVWGLAIGRLRGLPHPVLLISPFIFLPLPHYFTLADPLYMQTMRSWLAFMAVIVLLRRASDAGAAVVMASE